MVRIGKLGLSWVAESTTLTSWGSVVRVQWRFDSHQGARLIIYMDIIYINKVI